MRTLLFLTVAVSASLLASTTANAALVPPASSQVIADNTMNTRVTPIGPNPTGSTNFSVDRGQTVGSNLFHSFSTFTIKTGDTVTFEAPATPISNIISRVTGGETSKIYGTIATKIPGVNIYLVNPSGIVFGPSAQVVDVNGSATSQFSGSFYATTASYLTLGSTGRFDATTPAKTLLTSDPPSAFGFIGPNPAPITFSDADISLSKGAITVLGGDLTIENTSRRSGTILSAPGGINLVSVGSEGVATLTDVGIDTASFNKMGKVEINKSTFGSQLKEVSTSGGRIFISAGSFTVSKGTLSTSSVNGKGGDISITAKDSITLDKGASINNSTSGPDAGNISLTTSAATIENQSEIALTSSGSGNAGKLTISANTVSVASGGIISTESSQGKGGDINITASKAITITGQETGQPTNISSNSKGAQAAGNITLVAPTVTVEDAGGVNLNASGSGNAGNLTISASELVVRRGGYLSTASSSSKGGDISITAANTVNISGADETGGPSRITSSTNGAQGAGNITVTTPTMDVTDQGFISADTLGTGKAGDVIIKTTSLAVNSGGKISTGTSLTDAGGQGGTISIAAFQGVSVDNGAISAATTGSGGGGNISIGGSNISISNGGVINSTASGSGNAGNITVNAGDLVMNSSGSMTASTTSTGNAGNINLNVNRLSLSNGAAIEGAGNAGKGGSITINATQSATVSGSTVDVSTSGTGDAGTLTIVTPSLSVSDKATVFSASSGDGNAGGITVETGQLTVSKGGRIETSAEQASHGKGGHIGINATGAISISGDGTTIATDTAGSGDAGSIEVTAPILAITDRATISASSRSTTGKAGTITVTTGNLTMAGGTITTEASSKAGGSIFIDPAFAYLNNSSITTSVKGGTGDSGNILFSGGTLILEKSAVTANAEGGNGGNIGIAARVFLTDPASFSNITATSQKGLAGTVDINAPLVDVSGNLVMLPEATLPGDLSPRTCGPPGETSSFIVRPSGRQYQPGTDLLAF